MGKYQPSKKDLKNTQRFHQNQKTQSKFFTPASAKAKTPAVPETPKQK